MSIRIAVIGVGSMGKHHVRTLHEIDDVDLVGIADTNDETVQIIAKRYGVPAYTDYRRLLEETHPDAVSIVVPTLAHHRVAMDVMKYGCHLLIEKPIAPSVQEAQEIIEEARRRKLILMIGHIERFNPAIQELRKLLRENRAGKIFNIEAFRQGPFPPRHKDSGVIIDLAVHDIDIIRYLTDDEVERVFAEINRFSDASDDLLSSVLRLKGGIVASLNIDWITPTKIREIRVHCERGLYMVNYITQDLIFFENASAPSTTWDTLGILRGVSEGKMIRNAITKTEPLRREIEIFLDAIHGRCEVPVTGHDSLTALIIAQKIQLSGKEHRVVTMT
ncbi:hypothetical protein AUJ46_00990 [Candidatus Peregrinibacteria bacterium CG1_02_54_53]|nr:MAG: hypothetical protein AUJ46_00990 [Candidatus Peregrinibacteria bacterium CG1_02_54_53]